MIETKKMDYTKPAAKMVEWDFNEAICNTVVVNSTCLTVEKETAVNAVENRADITGEWGWTRVGSR